MHGHWHLCCQHDRGWLSLQHKVEEAMAQYGVETKTEVIDLALKELLRKKAVERIMSSMGRFPNMITSEELEAPEKRHYERARRR